MYKIGIDLGGSKIEGILLGPNNEEIERKRIATEQEKGYAHILARIQFLYEDLKCLTNGSQHTLGLGTPGSISLKTGLLKNSNTLCMNGKPFATDLENLLKKDIAFENDANCFALAEAIMGAGEGCKTVFGVIMGTGCGGGIVVNQELQTGIQNIAGEWGHMSIDPQGPVCYCQKKGCVETFISGGGLERRYLAEFKTKKKLPEILVDYRAGDKNAEALMKDFFFRFGIALSNLINILDPDVVVLGGGVSNVDELYTLGIEEVKKYIFNDECRTKIVKNILGDSAGVIGAALIGKEQRVANV
ncbi:MAG: ROK family protein [Cytophagaceae bacterium]